MFTCSGNPLSPQVWAPQYEIASVVFTSASVSLRPRTTMPRNSEKPRVNVSKTLSWLLRHGAVESGLKLTPDGFAKVSDVLRLPQFKSSSVEQIRDIVTVDAKNRYSLRESDGELYICANQGHSIVLEAPILRPILSAEECPQAIHGTYRRFMKDILEKGLLPMGRTHIHFSKEEPSTDRTVSGIRPSCEVLIYLDIVKLLADGIPLFESMNGVVLSPGNEGKSIPKEYFLNILDRKWKIEEFHFVVFQISEHSSLCISKLFDRFSIFSFMSIHSYIFVLFSSLPEIHAWVARTSSSEFFHEEKSEFVLLSIIYLSFNLTLKPVILWEKFN